jgi:ribosomal protein S18 acetylase RimI-like enzyme
MKIELLVREDVAKYKEKMLDFYDQVYASDRAYIGQAIDNTQLACVLFDKDKKVFGACRILTDLTKHAHIIDFIVHPDLRGQGWGSKILTAAAEECEKMGCMFIGLTCVKELFGFYEKVNFRPNDGFNYLKYKG